MKHNIHIATIEERNLRRLAKRRIRILAIICGLTLASSVGCSDRKIEVEETRTSVQSSSHSDSSLRQDDPRAQYSHRESTTTTTVDQSNDDSGCDGVLSCTVDVLGEIIALPFKAVGYLVQAIF